MISVREKRGKERRGDPPDLQEVSHHSPGYGGAVIGCRAAAQLVYEDERVRGGVGEDGPGLLE